MLNYKPQPFMSLRDATAFPGDEHERKVPIHQAPTTLSYSSAITVSLVSTWLPHKQRQMFMRAHKVSSSSASSRHPRRAGRPGQGIIEANRKVGAKAVWDADKTKLRYRLGTIMILFSFRKVFFCTVCACAVRDSNLLRIVGCCSVWSCAHGLVLLNDTSSRKRRKHYLVSQEHSRLDLKHSRLSSRCILRASWHEPGRVLFRQRRSWRTRTDTQVKFHHFEVALSLDE